MTFGLEFWGVRGSIACAGPQHVFYGGNTSCIQVWAADQTIVLDAGTGIRPLGQALLDRGIRESTLLLTHTHWDHINGFPFFAPAFRKENRLVVRAGHLSGAPSLREVFDQQMTPPMFPVPLKSMRAALSFEEFRAGDAFSLGAHVQVRTVPLRHPDGATGYRIECGGKALCYVTDTEHVPGVPDKQILELIQGADLLIYDSTYADEDFQQYIGWGHSTWQEGVRLCEAAGVRSLAIFHHEPGREDDHMRAVERAAQQAMPTAIVAREGLRVHLVNH